MKEFLHEVFTYFSKKCSGIREISIFYESLNPTYLDDESSSLYPSLAKHASRASKYVESLLNEIESLTTCHIQYDGNAAAKNQGGSLPGV